MNGSRTNPKIPKDIYQDFDIVYVVTETKWFLEHKDWISVFGEPAIVQEPDKNDMAFGENLDISQSYGWLMLFTDDSRIDLHIETIETMRECYGVDKLTVPLLDKDNILPTILPPSDEDYHVKKPTEPQYVSCCNNFWWCLNNVAKGIKRDQLSYTMWMYHVVVRNELHKMLDWYIGINTDFSVSVGANGKYYKNYLPTELYELFAKTYSDSHYENFWESIFMACDLFHAVAVQVAKYFNYSYLQSEEDGIRKYLVKTCQ